MNLFLLQLKESVLIALQSIRANKLRSLLTTLGIVIGIVSVTSMNMMMSGIDNAFQSSLTMIGNDVLYIQKFPWFANRDDWWSFRNRPELQESYITQIREQSQHALFVVPRAGAGGDVKFNENSVSGVFVNGVVEDELKVSGSDLAEGRFFTELENAAGRSVIVLGSEVAKSLFDRDDPIGKKVVLNGQPYSVIGVLAKQGKFLGLFSRDNQVMIPFGTFKKYFGIRRGITISVKVKNEQKIEDAKGELTYIMRKLRRLGPAEEDNFAINQQEAFKQQLDGISAGIYGVGIFITGLSLIVGMIGVMNIMFVSVKERTREIGIRKALGATRKILLVQFLIEAMTISLIGGLIGLSISAVLKFAISSVFVAEMPLGVVLVSLFLSLVVGLIAGILPANSAAKQDPIEALRYE
ncbi:MAG: ABC transporter permease [Bacteroidetes bacterium]|nr:ABC transporter permease [Bacteroidota bacterium]